ncbi:hypothetical protein ACFLSJ_01715 [Verrucomicrobiota bacterium]
MSSEDRIEALCWTEWKKECALALCSEQSRSALTRFAHSRFRTYARRYAHTVAADAPVLDSGIRPDEAWHLFEVHLVTRPTTEGKRYKDWIFLRVVHSEEPMLEVIESGASLIMREVVREYLRGECSPAGTVSISEPVWIGEGTNLTLEDLLPGEEDPRDEVTRRECERLARELARRVFADTSDRERVALTAKALGLGLSLPAVLAAAGCRKSVLSETLRSLIERVAGRARAEHSRDDAETLLLLSFMAINHTKALALDWAKAKPVCGPLFDLLEEPVTRYEAA